ncbi:MAG: 16S rRNA processing protein RimM [Proteobacteria bacterium]|nr:16S rRNA processing protein RimM [Pseudomonadota bacterium]
MSSSGLLAIGKVVGLHGIKGEVKLLPYPGLEDFPCQALSFKKGKVLNKHKVLGVRTNKSIFLLKIEGFSSRETSAELVGSEVMIEKAELPENEPGEYYLFELIGLDVFSEDGTRIGPVTGIMPAGGNDLLQVEAKSGEVLIPAIEEFLLDVDIENGKVVVHLLEGMLPEPASGEVTSESSEQD